MSAIVQQATQFFFDQFGHLLMDENSRLPDKVESRAHVTCSLCHRDGPGVWDGRGNQGVHRCLPCWSFYQRADTYFPGDAKDLNFSGKVKTGWVVDETGVAIYVSPKTFDLKAPEDRVKPRLQFFPTYTPIMDILDGPKKNKRSRSLRSQKACPGLHSATARMAHAPITT